jgi:hypothetical protein
MNAVRYVIFCLSVVMALGDTCIYMYRYCHAINEVTRQPVIGNCDDAGKVVTKMKERGEG